jgi:hypothetical protein
METFDMMSDKALTVDEKVRIIKRRVPLKLQKFLARALIEDCSCDPHVPYPTAPPANGALN